MSLAILKGLIPPPGFYPLLGMYKYEYANQSKCVMEHIRGKCEPGEEVDSVKVIMWEERAQDHCGELRYYTTHLSMKLYTILSCSLIDSFALILFPQPDCKIL